MRNKTICIKNQKNKNMIYIILSVILLSFSCVAGAVEKFKIKTLEVNDYKMSYIEKGQGEPLILVHGALSDYRTWSRLLSELSENNRTIAVSLRHYYPEKWNGKGNDLSLQQHADDLAAFIQALNLGPVNLLGHSRGGAVALLTASKNPTLIRRLILADPSPLTQMLEKSPEIQALSNSRKTNLQNMMDFFNKGDTDGGLELFVNHIAGPNAWTRTSEVRRNSLRDNAWTQISILKDIETPFTCQNAAALSMPLLLITGDASAPLYGHMNAALNKCLTSSNIAIISDAGHMMFNANPTAFIFEVQDFILQ